MEKNLQTTRAFALPCSLSKKSSQTGFPSTQMFPVICPSFSHFFSPSHLSSTPSRGEVSSDHFKNTFQIFSDQCIFKEGNVSIPGLRGTSILRRPSHLVSSSTSSSATTSSSSSSSNLCHHHDNRQHQQNIKILTYRHPPAPWCIHWLGHSPQSSPSQ